MTQPLSVNAQTNVELNESCNCCWFFKRKKPKPVVVAEEIAKKILTPEEKQVSQVGEKTKD